MPEQDHYPPRASGGIPGFSLAIHIFLSIFIDNIKRLVMIPLRMLQASIRETFNLSACG